MHRKTMFNIRIDFDKSHDSYLYDKNRNEFFLDLFGLFATLPLGYSHPVFQSEAFREEYNRVAGVKVPNGEIISDEGRSFLEMFSGHRDMAGFEHFHFCCTGALAIEAAIKVAMDQKAREHPVVMSLKGSFHGINGYGGFVTDRFSPVKARLDRFPRMGWPQLHSPSVIYRDGDIDEKATANGLDRFVQEFDKCLQQQGADNVVALLVEPVQSTYGDHYFPKSFFSTVRDLCDRNDICLVFDEIQTGFGTTGRMWYFQHIGIVPDIVVFGKKTQTSGIMAKKKFDQLFKTPVRLEVTWDGQLADMIRCKHILNAYEQHDVLRNVGERSQQIREGLGGIVQLRNFRSVGHLMAFDFDTPERCDRFWRTMIEKRLLCNKTRDKTIRFRPNLNLSSGEAAQAIDVVKSGFA